MKTIIIGLVASGKTTLYAIQNMKYVKDNCKLRQITDFDCSQKMYDGLRLAEQTEFVSSIDEKYATSIKDYVAHLENIRKASNY